MVVLNKKYRQLVALVAAVLLCVLVLLSHFPTFYQIKTFFTYTTRPLWDTPLGPKGLIPHYYAEGLGGTEGVCRLHGWDKRTRDVEVWDAVMLSTELDLLEIRLAEADPHVDLFIVVLSTHSFTGLPRTLALPPSTPASPSPDLPQSLAEFRKKLLVVHHQGRPLAHKGEDPFVLEREQRETVSRVIGEQMAGRRKKEGQVVVLMGDVDELPRRETVQLLRSCRWEGERDGTSTWGKMHLQLRNYLYSFEWPTDYDSWRLQAHVWLPGTSVYGHSQVTDRVLVDSGWHCSFCFRTLGEFGDKMTGYSHTDRLGSSAKELLDPKHIQQVICDGGDVFDMWREAYRWKDFVALLSLDRSLSAVGLPRRLIEQGRERFDFLLPGGCVREDRV